MQFTSCSSPTMSSSRSFAQHVSISSLDDLTYTVPSASSSGTNDAIQTIVTGRKCWKTIKGKGEVVWPPYLEAALVEGVYHVIINIANLLIFITCRRAKRSRKIQTSRDTLCTSIGTLPDAKQVHIRLYSPDYWETSDAQAGRQSPSTTKGYLRRQTK